MSIKKLLHYTDNILTRAEAREGLSGEGLKVIYFTNFHNVQSVVHSHPYHELVIPVRGSDVRYSVKGSVYLLHVDELIYFPAQGYHSGRYNITDTVSERIVLQVEDGLWREALRRSGLEQEDWVRDVVVLDSYSCLEWDLKGLMERMARSAELSGDCRELVLEGQLIELLLLMNQSLIQGRTSKPSTTSLLVAHAVSYLQAHYQDPELTVARLARETYTSREHLSRAFKEYTLESVHVYLTNLRMQHCRRALSAGMPVLDACGESGFSDYSSFLKTFRRMYGMTPGEYRDFTRQNHTAKNKN